MSRRLKRPGKKTVFSFIAGMGLWALLVTGMAAAPLDKGRQTGDYGLTGTIVLGSDPETGERVFKPRLVQR